MCIFYLFTTHTHPLSYEQQVIVIIIIVMHKTTLAKSNQLLEPAPLESVAGGRVDIPLHWTTTDPVPYRPLLYIHEHISCHCCSNDYFVQTPNWMSWIDAIVWVRQRERVKENGPGRRLGPSVEQWHYVTGTNNMRSPVTVAIPFLEHVLLLLV